MNIKFTLTLLYLFLLVSKPFTSNAQVNKSDSLALVDFYHSTNGPDWHNHNNWLTTAPVSTWYGVSITNNRVTVLSLYGNNLGGTIPFSIGNLTALITIDFSFGHNLHGIIPSSLGNLTNLTSLSFMTCKLSGKIPETLGNLTKLTYLILSGNKLTGTIPTSIGNLVNLNILDFSFNQLSGPVPTQLERLTNLSTLFLINNEFTFAGMLYIVRNHSGNLVYSPQATIPVHQSGNILSVYTGGAYELERDTFRWYKNGNLVATIKGDSTFSATQYGSYYVTVSNSVATALTLYSNTVSYTTGDNLIASKIKIANNISVYPNPTTSSVTLMFNAKEKYTVSIVDVSGKVLQVKTGVSNNTQNVVKLYVNNYATGLYFINVNDEKNNKTVFKFVKE